MNRTPTRDRGSDLEVQGRSSYIIYTELLIIVVSLKFRIYNYISLASPIFPPCSPPFSRRLHNKSSFYSILSYFLYRTSPPVDPAAPTFHAVANNVADTELFGELEPKDTEWLCSGGFVTETQTFYVITDDGTSLMCQVIHSSVG